MNLKKYILIAAVAMLPLASCTDRLEVEQLGVMTTNTYTTADDTGVEQFIAAVYAQIYGNSYDAVMLADASCWDYLMYDLKQMGWECAEPFTYDETADTDTYTRSWTYFYRIAYWCSMIIENVPDNNVASEDVKTQVVAEARAIRAIMMMWLCQLYGDAPLVDGVLDGSEGNNPKEDSFEWIVDELETAAADLPSKGGLGQQSSIGGRLTREAAYAFMGRAQLWNEDYSGAASTLYDKVISTGYYALMDDYNEMNSSSWDFCDENIWEFDFNESSSYAQGQAGYWALLCWQPSLSYWWSTYASLLFPFGMGAQVASGHVSFMTTHDGYGSERYNAQILDVCSASLMGSISTPYSNCEGYLQAKYLCLAEDITSNYTYDAYTIRNTPYMRYAEVLLNYAEAVAMGGSAGSGLSGLEALNLVRTRAGLDEATTLSMDDETYGIKAERRAELFAEGHRFIDLVRWGDAATELADCGKYSYMTNLTNAFEYSGITMYFGFEVVESATGGDGFKSGKHELFPIPQTEINTNKNLTQNTGW